MSFNFDLLKLVTGRLAIVASIYLANLAIAGTTSPELFGSISFLIFLVKSIPQITLGINQGFIFSVFNEKIPFINTYTWTYIFIFAIYEVGCFYFVDPWVTAFSAVVFILVLVEPYLKTQRDFLIVLYPELFLIMAFSLGIILQKQGMVENIRFSSLLIVLATTLVYVLKLGRKNISRFATHIKGPSISLTELKYLVVHGMPSFVFNFMFFFFLFSDRYYLQRFDQQSLGVVMLAYQIAIGAGLISTIINSTTIIEVGEIISKSPKKLMHFVVRRMAVVMLINVIFYFCVLLFLYFFSNRIYPEYPDLLSFVAYIGAGLIFLNAYGTISPVCFHLRKQSIQNLMMTLGLILHFIILVLVNQGSLTILHGEAWSFFAFSLAMICAMIYGLKLANDTTNKSRVATDNDNP